MVGQSTSSRRLGGACGGWTEGKRHRHTRMTNAPTDLLHDGDQGPQLVRRHGGEEVVLDLDVDAGRDCLFVGPGGFGVGGQDLMRRRGVAV